MSWNDEPDQLMSQSAPNLQSLFEAAIAFGSAEARASYLDRACPDPQMRREVESLLAGHDQPDTVFTAKTIRVEPRSKSCEAPPIFRKPSSASASPRRSRRGEDK
jgi:hypothetical protein